MFQLITKYNRKLEMLMILLRILRVFLCGKEAGRGKEDEGDGRSEVVEEMEEGVHYYFDSYGRLQFIDEVRRRQEAETEAWLVAHFSKPENQVPSQEYIPW